MLFEMETIPLIESAYGKGHHSLMIAPGNIGRACVACGTRTRYFCYSCSADAPTVLHCCSASRDGSRDCFARLHRSRRTDYNGEDTIYTDEGGGRLIQRMQIEQSGGKNSSRIQKQNKSQQRRGSKKGCSLNPHHNT